MDQWLSETLSSAPRPSLSSGFDERLARRLRPRRLTARGRIVMLLYSAAAIVLSIWTMRSASIEWPLVGAAMLVPLLVVMAISIRHFNVARWHPF
jgi:membrane protein YdbS with pleckstrin-like domain